MGQKINPVFKSSTTCNFQAMNIDKLNLEKNCDSEDSQEPMNDKVLVKHFVNYDFLLCRVLPHQPKTEGVINGKRKNRLSLLQSTAFGMN